MKMDSDFQGPEKLILGCGLLLLCGKCVDRNGALFLCMGPFYIAEHISTMIEPDLPYYKTLEIKMAARLFQMMPESEQKGMFCL